MTPKKQPTPKKATPTSKSKPKPEPTPAPDQSSSNTTTIIKDQRDKLYEKCLAKRASKKDHTFSQAELLDMGVTSDVGELMILCQQLSSKQLFSTFTQHGAACWRVRDREQAKTLAALSPPELSVYNLVADSGANGVWGGNVGVRTGLYKSTANKAVKQLESKRIIKRVKGAKVCWILFDQEPPEDVTGGSWYKDGDLDTGFVQVVADLIVWWVRHQSWVDGPRIKRKRTAEGSPRKARKVGRHAGETAGRAPRGGGGGGGFREEPEPADEPIRAPAADGHFLIPHPAGYQEYPTSSEIWRFLEDSQVVQGKEVEVKDINYLLEMLVFDGRLEVIGKRRISKVSSDEDDEDEDGKSEPEEEEEEEEENMYRWRPSLHGEGKVHSDGLGEEEVDELTGMPKEPEEVLSGFSATPCSRCPAFTLCEDGGPVDARSCGYFADWLDPPR